MNDSWYLYLRIYKQFFYLLPFNELLLHISIGFQPQPSAVWKRKKRGQKWAPPKFEKLINTNKFHTWFFLISIKFQQTLLTQFKKCFQGHGFFLSSGFASLICFLSTMLVSHCHKLAAAVLCRTKQHIVGVTKVLSNGRKEKIVPPLSVFTSEKKAFQTNSL